MNDYEYCFMEDIRNRKSLVPSSRKKKNGSKSKKVTLPQDRMSKKQWESKNGEVMTIQMNQPMTYEEFKSIPEDLQERYLACLVDGYHVTSKMLAEMMGTDHRTLRSYIRNHDFTKIHFRKGAIKLTEEERRDWDEFLSRRDISEEESIVEPLVGYVQERDVIEEPEEPNDISEEGEDETPFHKKLSCSNLTMIFDGEIDFAAITVELSTVFGEKPRGKCTVIFDKEDAQ